MSFHPPKKFVQRSFSITLIALLEGFFLNFPQFPEFPAMALLMLSTSVAISDFFLKIVSCFMGIRGV